MKTEHVRPLGGRLIRVPERPSQILPAEGMLVPITDFWQARIKDGDVEVFTPKPKVAPRRAAAPKPTAAPKED